MKTDYDVIIVGAGPAGLSASLAAIADKKSYLCIDQNTFGGTVYSFPRQKLVMSHPFDLPIIGKKKFASNEVSKESLLEYWNTVRRQTGLVVKEGVKFDGLKKENELFRVQTSSGSFTAKKVILALGVRGSPRKLGVPGEDTQKVTYNLIDPEQYQNKNIVVVGGGNAGVEAAQMLGQPKYKNKVHLLVRGPVFDRCNEENKKRIMAMSDLGQVKILFNSSIKEIHKDKISLINENKELSLPNDFVFVFAGAEMPHQFLMSLGISIDKKFGEGLRKAG